MRFYHLFVMVGFLLNCWSIGVGSIVSCPGSFFQKSPSKICSFVIALDALVYKKINTSVRDMSGDLHACVTYIIGYSYIYIYTQGTCLVSGEA